MNTDFHKHVKPLSELRQVRIVLRILTYTFLTLERLVQQTLIPRWPTVGRVAHTVVRLFTHDCTGGISTRYPTADSMADIGSTSASVE